MNRKNLSMVAFAAVICLVSVGAQAAGVDVQAWCLQHADLLAGLSLAGVAGTTEQVMKSLDTIEKNLSALSTKAEGELATLGKVSQETKSALDTVGNQQREMADRLTQLEQKGTQPADNKPADQSWGAQLVKNASLKQFQEGGSQKCRIEVKNTLLGSDTNVAPDRKPGIVGGAFQPLTLNELIPTLPTSSNAIEYTREDTFVNNAAETAEGQQKPESSITWTLVNQPVATVAHWIKISRQLAADNPALAAYVNTRMKYGVDRRVESQLVVGNGTTPNISGILKTGNFTAHGYLSGALGSTLKGLVLIRKIIADAWVAGYPADAILLNPVDWAAVEIDLLTTNAGQVPFKYDENGTPRLWGLPVIQAIGVPAGTVAVGAFAQAYTIYNREDTVIELSESDADNFTKNLITVRAERRLLLATERPGAVRAGLLSPPAS